MWRQGIGAATFALALAGPASAHSPYEARNTLASFGYYDVEIERASLPYSFTACKRGTRYHIHVDWHGDLVQVDPIGGCRERTYGRRWYDDRDY
jgi:hypothetical protein